MKKLVIFDLDGTLLNTIEDLGQAANHALQQNDYPTHSIASYPFFVGNGVRKLMERVLPENSRDAQTVDALLKDFKAYYDEHLHDYSKPYQGIVEMLEELSDKGVKLAVASNKYYEAVQRLIAYAFPGIDFVAVEGQKEGVNVKPDPSIVFNILAQAHVEKADTLYVGFWTDRGHADADCNAFLKTLRGKKVFLFGTAGFGGSAEYFAKILSAVQAELDPSNTVVGTYMCQGRMPQSVRQRYEAMKQQPNPASNLDMLIENFDRALAHPDAGDLERLKQAVQ